MPRHRYQVGHSRFSLTAAAAEGRFYVREEYWLMGRHDEEEDLFEDHGPFTADEAQREILRLELDRGARQMATHC